VGKGGVVLDKEVRQSRDSCSFHNSSSKALEEGVCDSSKRALGPTSAVRHATDKYMGDADDKFEHQEQIVTGVGSKVSFYFTNILEFLPVFRLRQHFEVCGILLDVYMTRQQNSRGQVHGFVRFSNVKNVDKLSQALNNVWFGHLRVWACEARFDRFTQNNKKPLVISRNDMHMEEVKAKKEKVRDIEEGEFFISSSVSVGLGRVMLLLVLTSVVIPTILDLGV